MTTSRLARATQLIRALTVGASLLAFGNLPAEAASPRVFAQPEEAASALAESLRAADGKAVLTLLGSAAREWIFSGDAATDRVHWQEFLKAYDAQHSVVERSDGRAVLIIGSARYPFPIPIVRGAGGWRFDPVQGKQEILNRRIGHNELNTIEVMREIVAAQREFLLMPRSDGAPRQYAKRFVSSPGQRDGLYWPSAEGEAPSPLGPLVAEARAEGYGKHSAGQPFHGYRFKLLRGQGPAAQGGEQTYSVEGLAVGGFAVLAFPAQYGLSGVKSFIVNQEGVVFEQDLGPRTASLASTTELFDPGPGWQALSAR